MSDKKYEIYINGKPFEVSKKIYTFLKRSNWREEYYTIKRKRATVILDEKSSTIIVKPSRELSLDRLEEIGEQIPDTTEPMDERIIRKLWIENALSKLTVKERFIISEIYLYGSTEKEVAEILNTSQQFVNKEKHRILCKLYEIMTI